eukprot:732835-Hanusia_phi.AAC.1
MLYMVSYCNGWCICTIRYLPEGCVVSVSQRPIHWMDMSSPQSDGLFWLEFFPPATLPWIVTAALPELPASCCR